MDVNELKDFKDFVMALQIIKGFCVYIGNCDLCPFYTKIKGRCEKSCFFAYPYEGKIPEEWDIKSLLEDDNNG